MGGNTHLKLGSSFNWSSKDSTILVSFTECKTAFLFYLHVVILHEIPNIASWEPETGLPHRCLFAKEKIWALLGARCHPRCHHGASLGFLAWPCSHVKPFSRFISLSCGICTGLGPFSGARLPHLCLTSDLHPLNAELGDASVLLRRR